VGRFKLGHLVIGLPRGLSSVIKIFVLTLSLAVAIHGLLQFCFEIVTLGFPLT